MSDTPHPTPTFATERLILEPLGLRHAPSYRRHFVDWEVIRHLSAAVPWPYPEDGVESFIQDLVLPGQGRSRWDWAICLKERPGEAIGSVGLWRPGIPEHRGFWLGQAYWGKGLMTEANVPVVDFAFDELGYDELILSNARGNTRSRRIKEKVGAEHIGTKPSDFVDEQFSESELWRLTPEQWRAWRARA